MPTSRPRPPRPGPSLLVGAALSALPSSLLAVVWLVGDLSYTGPVEGGLDRMVEPLDVGPGAVTALGVLGLAGLVTALLVCWRTSRARGALLCLTAAGGLLGLTYRTVTAGGVGANIGAGLAILLLGPVVIVLLALAGWLLLPRRRSRTSGKSRWTLPHTRP